MDMAERELTHLDDAGRARMVDVGAKDVTARRAVARAVVRMSPETAARGARGDAPKGDVLGLARIAGMQAAKRTWRADPALPPLSLSFASTSSADGRRGRRHGHAGRRGAARPRTGVEMEAMTAASVAALTVYDMVKASSAASRSSRSRCWRSPAGAASGAADWRRGG